MRISKSKRKFEDKCQTYQKWLIKINSQRFDEPVLIIWLTDMSDNNIDKLILTRSNKIVGAANHIKLFQFLRDNKNELPDPINTITWLNEVIGLDTISATEYNIDLIEKSLNGSGFNKVSINESINFINLFNDVAKQLDDVEFDELSSNKGIKELWEFGYNEIFWKEFGNNEELPAVRIPHFRTNYKLLNKGMNQMIDAFINKIEILDK